jgi:hypothetical protein
MEYNNDFKYDLKIGQTKEIEIGNIFKNSTIEIKYDLQALETKNVYVEYFSRGKLSGISTSQADYYCFAFGNTFHFISTALLKLKCRKHLGTERDRKGGDLNSSKGILLPINELF